MKVILIRLDKIGDLIATLPVDRVSFLGNADVKWVIAEGLGFIATMAEPRRDHIELSLKTPWKSFWKLVSFLRKESPDKVVMFYGPWWASLAMWLSGARVRAGRISQWHSFLFFNKSLRQSRSLAQKHEADYNMDLLCYAFDRDPSQHRMPFLDLRPHGSQHFFEKTQLGKMEYFVVHPGMAGSAWNWPQSHYNSLIEKLIEIAPVVITGTSGDDQYLTEIKPKWQHHPKVRWLQNELTMDELIFLLRHAKAVVAPSTGVLHLAASCRTKAVGIYSPVRAHSAVRWGPRGEEAKSLTPDIHGSQATPESMASITPAEVMIALGL